MWFYWFLFAAIAFISGFISMTLGMAGKKQQIWMLISLTFTVLFMLAKFDQVARWVITNHQSALGEMVPFMNWKNQLFCLIVLLMNGIPAVKEYFASLKMR